VTLGNLAPFFGQGIPNETFETLYARLARPLLAGAFTSPITYIPRNDDGTFNYPTASLHAKKDTTPPNWVQEKVIEENKKGLKMVLTVEGSHNWALTCTDEAFKGFVRFAESISA